ncbi:MAG: alpha/beta fold hydrolase [Phycisphaeraceae bacterium]
MPHDPNKPGPMDWLSRLMAWATFKIPRIAPSRWAQLSNRRRGNDLISESFTVKAADSVALDASYFPPQHPRELVVERGKGNLPPLPAALPVVFAHGWTETKEFHFRLARVLTAAGHPVVMFDQRGHGSSGGRYSTLGVLEQHDLGHVIDESIRRGWIDNRVITMGVSMGAASSLCHAAQDKRVAGVVAYAPFARFTDAIRSYQRRYAKWFSADWAVRGMKQFCNQRDMDIDQAAPLDMITRIGVPVLFVVGTQDVNLPAEDHAHVIMQASGRDDCGFVAAEGADHFNVVTLRWAGVDEAVLRFCESAMHQCASIDLSRKSATA